MAVVKIVVASMLALACSGALYQYIGTKLDEAKYPPIGRMVDVGGYKLHMMDKGVGGPTVVISTGLGNSSLDWSLVYPEIAKFTRVIVADRPGYAWSDASPLSRTSESFVLELHTMLHHANVPGPYILVGHSFGGLNVRLFASKYPDEVAGVILVDASHENQAEVLSFLPKTTENFFSKWRMYFERYLGVERFIRERAAQTPAGKQSVEIFPKEVQDSYLASRLTSKFMEARIGETSNFKFSRQQLKLDGGIIGNKPLIVITAGKKKSVGFYTQEQVDLLHNKWLALQADLAAKSSNSKHIIAENSGHMINFEQPAIIIDAVREMIDELRNK